MNRLAQRCGHAGLAGQRVGELLAQIDRTLGLDEGLLGEAVAADQLVEPGPVELAVGAAEGGIGNDRLDDRVVGDRQPIAAGAIVQRGLRHHLRQDLPLEPECPGLVIGDGPASPA